MRVIASSVEACEKQDDGKDVQHSHISLYKSLETLESISLEQK